MMIRDCIVAAAAAAIGVSATVASAGATITLLPPGFLVTDIATNGIAACGNVQGDGSYETFRWTPTGGVERLGRATVPVIGVGAGTPDISYNGRRISATILSSDNLETIGLWDISTGWTEAMPPMPADGRVMDLGMGSAWGISGDGRHVTGFYWNTAGDAQGCSWSVAGGMYAVDKTPGRSVRINAANLDGKVLVGWEERYDGPWCPTVWRNGVKMTLQAYGIPTTLEAVNSAGTILGGDSVDESMATRSATLWRWNGTSYVAQRLGWLPGTQLTSGGARVDAVSDNGQIAVGMNMYSWYPGGSVDGFVWTPKTGMVKDTTYVASLGLTLPPGMDVRQINALSPDGYTIAGIGLLPSGQYQTFIIHLPQPGLYPVPRP
ncbi:MAG: hypothetical protein AMXMBFR58_12760 [Phycisphaerae bacterium]|nr:hypothetical protein [Phycisphaerales bacterium]